MTQEHICQFLRESFFLRTAPDDMLRQLAQRMEPVRLSAGEALFQKGDVGSSMYFVVEGSMRIHDGDLVLNHLGAGEIFGEVGALAEQERTASVTAELDSHLLRLDQKALYEVLDKAPSGVKPIIQGFCHRQIDLIHDVTDRSLRVQRFETEMEIARNIQHSFLPDSIPSVPGWDLQAYLSPAKEVAGDFYDFFVVPKCGCVGVVIGDVCDKGVGAALFMTLFRSLLRSTALAESFSEWNIAPADVASTLRHSIAMTNRYIAITHGRSSMFASVFFGLFVPETGQICYINSGHEPPFIVSDGRIRQQLETTGPVIGLFPDAEHEVKTAQLAPGDFLVAITDGVTDAKNPQGEQFSEDRLLAILTRPHQGAKGMLHGIVSDMESFVQNAAQYDDTTIVVVHREQ